MANHDAEHIADGTSSTETFVRHKLKPSVKRQHQIIALRIIAEGGGQAPVARIKKAIQARHPDNKWDSRYPIKVLADNDIIHRNGDKVAFNENLNATQIASLLAAIDERSVRTVGLRVEDTSWRPGATEWSALRAVVVKRDGEVCSVANCLIDTDLELDHRWRGSLLAAQGWSPAAINDPINLQLLCDTHHKQKTAAEASLIEFVTKDADN